MICARPYCESKEDRINGYCSEYCQDLHELQVEAETLLAEKKALQAEVKRLREALQGRNPPDTGLSEIGQPDQREQIPDVLKKAGW